MVASCTPCERSSTSSLDGQRVAAMRRRRSSSCSSEVSRWNGRTVVASVATDMCVSFSFVVPSEQLEEEEEDVQDVQEDARRDRHGAFLARAPQPVEVEDRVAAEDR